MYSRRILKRYLLAAAGLVLLVAVAACSDSGGSGKGAEASGETGLLRSGGDSVEIVTIPAPPVEKGVMPDLVGVALGDGEAALKEAGFKTGQLAGGVGVGTVFPPTLAICSQDQEPGSEPKKGTEVMLIVKQICD